MPGAICKVSSGSRFSESGSVKAQHMANMNELGCHSHHGTTLVPSCTDITVHLQHCVLTMSCHQHATCSVSQGTALRTLGSGCAFEHKSGRHLGCCCHIFASHFHGGLGGVGSTHVPDGAVLAAAAEQRGDEVQVCRHLVLPVLKVVQLVHTAWRLQSIMHSFIHAFIPVFNLYMSFLGVSYIQSERVNSKWRVPVLAAGLPTVVHFDASTQAA